MLGLVFGSFVVLMFLGIPAAAAIGFATFLPRFMDASFMGNAKVVLRAIIFYLLFALFVLYNDGKPCQLGGLI